MFRRKPAASPDGRDDLVKRYSESIEIFRRLEGYQYVWHGGYADYELSSFETYVKYRQTEFNTAQERARIKAIVESILAEKQETK